ncbi:MAG: DUF2971 domain-containing protein [Nitrospirales bacterium]
MIESKFFRWSSPNKFNDPFDHQARFVLDSNPDEFARLLTASIERVVFSDIVPPVSPVMPVSQLAAVALQLRSNRDRLPREEFHRKTHQLSINTAARVYNGGIDHLSGNLQEALCHSRVLCLSEVYDSLLMWSHYADGHRGVVFKLRCTDETDNSLLYARKVSYADTGPTFASAAEYAKHLTGEQTFDYATLCWKIALTKHTDWEYEREWRVHRLLFQEPPGDGYHLYPADPRIFEAIYLGCSMQNQEIARIVELIRCNLPATKILRGEKGTAGVTLSFTDIN